MKNNQLDNFEKFVKNSLDNKEVPYDPSDWDDMNKRLDNKNGKPFFKSFWFIAASIITGVAISYFTYQAVQKPTVEIAATENSVNKSDNNNITEPLNEETNTISETENNDETIAINPNVKEEQPVNTIDVDQNVNNNTSSETKELDNNEMVLSNNENSETTSDEVGTNHFESDSEITVIEEKEIAELNADFHFNINECCEGTKIDFEAKHQDKVNYSWKLDNEKFSNETTPSYTFEKAGRYTINLIVKSTIDNSVMKKSIDQVIIVHANPKVDFEWEELEENGLPSTSFINTTDDASKWNWNFGDGNTSDKQDPKHTYKKKGQYSVSLTAVNNENCSSTVNKKIIIEDDYNLLAPNSFTPNGDGINDYFLPAALNRLDGRFIMTIYSPTDGLIYETKNIDQPWNGVNQKTGEKCKESSYIWVVKLTTNTGKIEQYKGAVLLLK